MQNIKNYISEAYRYSDGPARAKEGAILEVELDNDGHFYWVDEKDYPNMKDWEIVPSKNSNGFVIKIGKLKDLD